MPKTQAITNRLTSTATTRSMYYLTTKTHLPTSTTSRLRLVIAFSEQFKMALAEQELICPSLRIFWMPILQTPSVLTRVLLTCQTVFLIQDCCLILPDFAMITMANTFLLL